jgi:hypothetical protein
MRPGRRLGKHVYMVDGEAEKRHSGQEAEERMIGLARVSAEGSTSEIGSNGESIRLAVADELES